ncbi:hypothetical protein ACHAWF_018335 [Thalassiosira exigua]
MDFESDDVRTRSRRRRRRPASAATVGGAAATATATTASLLALAASSARAGPVVGARRFETNHLRGMSRAPPRPSARRRRRRRRRLDDFPPFSPPSALDASSPLHRDDDLALPLFGPPDDVGNACRSSKSLRPGESLNRGEFLCHGDVRFGIDARGGGLVLGFAPADPVTVDWGDLVDGIVAGLDDRDNSTSANATAVDLTNTAATPTTASETTTTATSTTTTTAEGGPASPRATPTLLAWRAVPTTLFTSPSAPFALLTLSVDGNLLGYDDEGWEIYDSNYDYDHRTYGKKDGSVLVLSDECARLAGVWSSEETTEASEDEGEGGGEGGRDEDEPPSGYMPLGHASAGADVDFGSAAEAIGEAASEFAPATNLATACATLTSPPIPGMGHGMVTWGVDVRPRDLTAFVVEEPPTAAPAAPVDANEMPDNWLPDVGLPDVGLAVAASGSTPSPLSTSSPAQNLFDLPSPPSPSPVRPYNYETSSIVWGTVWIDADGNGRMDPGERSVPDFRVDLFECPDGGAGGDATDGGDDGSGIGKGVDSGGSNGGNGSGTAIQTATTDAEGTYWFHVPSGRSYRVRFRPPDDAADDASSSDPFVGRSTGREQGEPRADTDVLVIDETSVGWTMCEVSGAGGGPIQWNAGLRPSGDVEELDAGVDPRNPDSDAGAEGPYPPNSGYQLGWIPAGDLPAPPPPQAGAGDYSASSVSDPEAEPSAPPKASIGGHVYLDVDEDGSMDAKERAAAVGGYAVSDARVAVALADCADGRILEEAEVEFPGTYAFDDLEEGRYKLGYEVVYLPSWNGGTWDLGGGRGGEDDRGGGGKGASSSSSSSSSPTYSFVDGGEGSDPSKYETGCGKLGEGEVIDSGNVGIRMRPLSLAPGIAEGSAAGSEAPDGADASRSSAATKEGSESGGGNSFVPGLAGALVTLSIVAAAALFLVRRRGMGYRSFAGGGAKARADGGEEARGVRASDVRGELGSAKPTAAPAASSGSVVGSLVVEPSVVAGTPVGESETESGHESEEDGRGSFCGMEFALKNRDKPSDAERRRPQDDDEEDDEEEEEEEGYEVYDDEHDDEERGGGDGDDDRAAYGPVISDMIAKYSRKQREEDGAAERSRAGGAAPSPQRPVDWRQYLDRGGRASEAPGGAPPGSDPHHDDQASLSEASRSSDPPAASYRDIPDASSYGSRARSWDQLGYRHGAYARDRYAPGYAPHPQDQQYAPHPQDQWAPVDGSNQYASGVEATYYGGDQYASHEGAPHHGAYHEPDQYAPLPESGAFPVSYDGSHQYAPGGSYPANYGEDGGAVGSDDDSSGSDSSYTESEESDSDSSSEEESATGWSEGSSTMASERSGGGGSLASGAGGRARSNPRDDRSSWQGHPAAIPEHSTVEYRASGGGGGDVLCPGGGFAPPPPTATAGAFAPRPTTTEGDVADDGGSSVRSAESDDSSDPPGASYRNAPRFPLPPPPPKRAAGVGAGGGGRTTPPRGGGSAPSRASPPPRRPSPGAARYGGAAPPKASPPRRPSPGAASPRRPSPSAASPMRASPGDFAGAARGGSVPPPPPRRGYKNPSPPPPPR